MRAGEKPCSYGIAGERLTALFHEKKHNLIVRNSGSRMVLLHLMTNDSLELFAAARRAAERLGERGGHYAR
jgi:hypothetical protein